MPKVILLLVVLIAILAIIKFKENKQGDRSFKSEIVALDTSKVDLIQITPKGETSPVEFTFESDRWVIDLNGRKVQAEAGSIQELLGQLISLKPKRVASTTKDQWNQYELSDSLATQIKIKGGNKTLADLMVGKFTFDQSTRQMTSYVRNTKDKEVYAVDGYLSMLFNRASTSFRDNSVLIGNPELWKKLVFTYPADSSFSLVKQNNIWMMNGVMADSVKVDQYFSQIRMLTENRFYDEKIVDVNSNEIYSVRVEGDNFTPIIIDAYQMGNELITVSSLNKGNQFVSDKIKVALFVDKNSLLID